ncbi:hypothetical protein HWV62_42195 [Athelia sp. TMB]|nr:hypothetical protein HWV62_42195 [Athelia sp. TMB]
MDHYPPFFFHTNTSSRPPIVDQEHGSLGYRSENYSYSEPSPQASQSKPNLGIYCPPEAPPYFSEAPASPYSSASSGSFSNSSLPAESPLDMNAPHFIPGSSPHGHSPLRQTDTLDWRHAESPTIDANPYHDPHTGIHAAAQPHAMPNYAGTLSVPHPMPGHWPPVAQAVQSPQYVQRRSQGERYRSFTEVGHIALSSDAASGSGVDATSPGSYPGPQEIRREVRVGQDQITGYTHHAAHVREGYHSPSDHGSRYYSTDPRYYESSRDIRTMQVNNETDPSAIDPTAFSPRATHQRSSSDSNAYDRYGRGRLMGGGPGAGMSHLHIDSGYPPSSPVHQQPSASNPLPTHRPRPLYAFNGSRGVGSSYPGPVSDYHPSADNRGHELPRSGSIVTGMSGVPFPRQGEADGSRSGVVMKEEVMDDDSYAAAHLRTNPSVDRGDYGDEDVGEDEESAMDDNMRVWNDTQDEGAGAFDPHSHHSHASSSFHPPLHISGRNAPHLSFSSDGSFSDDRNASLSGSPTGSTSSPTNSRPRRHATSVPGPAPIPGLTKKSRGRRVPTLESSGSGPETYDGGGGRNPRAYSCDADGCGKIFARGEHLKRHVRSIHTYEKPHRCPFPGCGKDFSRHDNLRQHLRVHKGFEPAKNVVQNEPEAPR